MRRLVLTFAVTCCVGCPSAQNGTTPDHTVPPVTSAPTSAAPVDQKPEPKSSASADQARTLFVDAKMVDCEGEGPMRCLRVRESENAEWTLFYSAIEGFTHEEGFRYELKVAVSDVLNPPAGSSSQRYRLVEVVSKKKEEAK